MLSECYQVALGLTLVSANVMPAKAGIHVFSS